MGNYMKKLDETILYHSAVMIKKTIRNYLLLSITLFLSFAFFLGYLVFSDSEIFNKYKEIYSIPADYAVVTLDSGLTFGSPEPSKEAQCILLSRLEEMKETEVSMYYQSTVFLPHIGINAIVYFIPTTNNSFFWYDRDNHRKFELVSGSKTFTSQDQMLIDEESYFYLRKELNKLTMSSPEISFRTNSFRAYGVFKSPSVSSFKYNKSQGAFEGTPIILIPQSAVSDIDLGKINSTRLIIHSKNIKQAVNEVKKLNIAVWSSMEDHQTAAEMIKADIDVKRLIIIAIYIILCLNLYGCFGNSLEARKFEIGVKRALGAGLSSIIRQFAYEGLIVCSANILLATVAVINIALGYKYYLFVTQNIEWIIHLSTFSITAYLISSIFLSVLLISAFVYKSSLVEIVSYLKGE